MSLPKAQAIQRFIDLGNQCPNTLSNRDRIRVRGLLVSQALELSLRLEAGRTALRKLQKEAAECIEKVEIAQGIDETMDKALGGNREAGDLLGRAAAALSEDRLAAIVKEGKLIELEESVNGVCLLVEEVEVLISVTRELVDHVLKASK